MPQRSNPTRRLTKLLKRSGGRPDPARAINNKPKYGQHSKPQPLHKPSRNAGAKPSTFSDGSRYGSHVDPYMDLYMDPIWIPYGSLYGSLHGSYMNPIWIIYEYHMNPYMNHYMDPYMDPTWIPQPLLKPSRNAGANPSTFFDGSLYGSHMDPCMDP